MIFRVAHCVFADHALAFSYFPTLRRELRKLGITMPCRPATHHRIWMWH